MNFFDDFLQLIAYNRLSPHQQQFQQAIQNCFQPQNHGDWQQWLDAYEALPALTLSDVDLTSDTVSIHSDEVNNDTQTNLSKTLKTLHPWRKGPFDFFGVLIDTEWRSDWKWQRIENYIAPLKDRYVLDVGCGSGYHCWRMRGAGAKFVLGIDPSLKFLMQFQMLKKYLPQEPVFYLPLRSEDMPIKTAKFDTVFSMGVLYHRRSPFDHLDELKEQLLPGGELVLETLVIDGGPNEALVPADRYAQMRNVWFLPSCETLCAWLQRSGFTNVRVVDINTTTSQEQRTTEWMKFHSLKDFLDPQDKTLTVEGLPAPIRATIIANKK